MSSLHIQQISSCDTAFRLASSQRMYDVKFQGSTNFTTTRNKSNVELDFIQQACNVRLTDS